MKTALKIVIGLCIALVVVITGLSLFAKSYLTDERIRSYVIETAGKSLGRKVGMGAIRVSIFKGISVKAFEIKEKDSDEPFVTADDFILKYQLLPLLSKSLVIDELKLVNARLNVRKNSDGTFNFSDIGGPSGKKGPKEERAPGTGLPVALNVRSLSLKNASIEYAEPAGKLLKARLLVDADLGITSPSSGVIVSAGDFRLTVVEALLKDKPRPLKDLASKGAYKIDLNVSSRKLDIHEFRADIAMVPVSIRGYLSYAEPLSFSLAMDIPETRLAAVQQAVSPFLPEKTSLDGAVSYSGSMENTPATGSRTTFKGRLTLHSVAVAAKGYRPVINGSIGLTPDLITLEGMKLIAGTDSADITGQVRNYTREPDLQINLRAKTLNLDALASAGEKGDSGKPAPPASHGEEKEFEPVSTKLRAAGTIDIEKIIYKGVAVQNFRTAYAFRDNIFRISSMTGNTLSGSFGLQSAVDLSKRGAAYTLSADTKGVRIEEIINAFAPKAKDTLYGAILAKTDISGAGTLKETVKRNLKGKGNFSVKDGKLKNAKVSSGLLAFLGLQDLREIPMEKADGTFIISDGIVNLTSLIASKDLILDEKGTIGMNEQLNLSVLVKASDRISPKMLSQSSIAQFLSQEKGWTSIPLVITGTVSNPSYAIDMQAVGKTATQKLQKKAGEELFKALSGPDKKDKPAQQKSEPQQKKEESKPQDLLRGIFGN
jgi:uncharacterized protein involved in outer membrane biogenesis